MSIEFQVKTLSGNALQLRPVDYSLRIYVNDSKRGPYVQVDDRVNNATLRFLFEVKSKLLYDFIDAAAEHGEGYLTQMVQSFIEGNFNER